MRIGLGPGRMSIGWLALGMLVVALVATGCSSDDGGTSSRIDRPEDFLPKENSNWETSGEAQSGTTGAALQAIINGGWETYANHNMREFATRNYTGVGSEGGVMDVWIYEMATPADAVALYNDPELAATNPDADQPDDLGDNVLLETIGGSGKQLRFTRDKYFVTVVVTGTTTSQYARSEVVLTATGIDGEIAS